MGAFSVLEAFARRQPVLQLSPGSCLPLYKNRHFLRFQTGPGKKPGRKQNHKEGLLQNSAFCSSPFSSENLFAKEAQNKSLYR